MGLLGNIQRWKDTYLKYRIIDFYSTYNLGQISIGFEKKINKEEAVVTLELLGKCFDLLRNIFPQKYNDLQRDVQKFYIKRSSVAICDDGNKVNAIYISKIKGIVLPIEVFLSNIEFKNRVEFIASLILHEAQHARLHRLGFESNRNTLGRQERICYSIQRRFGEKISDGSEIIDYCNWALSVDLERFYSTESFIIRQIENIDSKDLPKWAKAYFVRKLMKKFKKMTNIRNDNDIPPDLKKWNY